MKHKHGQIDLYQNMADMSENSSTQVVDESVNEHAIQRWAMDKQ